MIFIRRTKAAPPAADRDIPIPSVYYASAVAPRGNVTEWVQDRGAALPFFSIAAAEKVRDFYAGRPNAGTIEILDEDERPVTLSPPGRSAEEAALAEYLELDNAPVAEVARVALAEIKLLEKEVAQLKAPPKPHGKPSAAYISSPEPTEAAAAKPSELPPAK